MADNQILSTVGGKQVAPQDAGTTACGIAESALQEGSRSPRDLQGWKVSITEAHRPYR